MLEMDTMDGGLPLEAEVQFGLELESLVLVTEALEPYVLSWPLGAVEDGEAECVVLALVRRESGVLLAVPPTFLPEPLIAAGNAGEEGALFGPSLRVRVPSILEEGGIISRTGMDMDVLVVDCLPEVLMHMRSLGADEGIAYSFDDDAPFSLPAMEELMPKVRRW